MAVKSEPLGPNGERLKGWRKALKLWNDSTLMGKILLSIGAVVGLIVVGLILWGVIALATSIQGDGEREKVPTAAITTSESLGGAAAAPTTPTITIVPATPTPLIAQPGQVVTPQWSVPIYSAARIDMPITDPASGTHKQLPQGVLATILSRSTDWKWTELSYTDPATEQGVTTYVYTWQLLYPESLGIPER